MRERRINFMKLISLICLTICMSIMFRVNASAAGTVEVRSWKELEDVIKKQNVNSEVQYHVNGELKVNKTITIDSGKKVVLIGKGYASAKREDRFAGSFFIVTGEGSSLRVKGDNVGGSMNFFGGSSAVDGRLVDVQSNGEFVWSKGANEYQFSSNKEGNIIYNNGGTVKLEGGALIGAYNGKSDIYQNGTMEIAYNNSANDRANIGITICVAKANATKITSDFYNWGRIQIDVANTVKANDILIAAGQNINNGNFASDCKTMFVKGNGFGDKEDIQCTDQGIIKYSENSNNGGNQSTNNKTQGVIAVKSNVIKTYAKKTANIEITQNVGNVDYDVTSSNSSVVKVAKSNGTIVCTALKCGECTVTIATKGSATVTPASAKVTVKVAPKKITLKKVKSLEKKKMNIQWKVDKTTTGYDIQYARDKKFTKKAKTISVLTSKATKGIGNAKNLKRGIYYYVHVRAYYTTPSGEKLVGSWSKTKKAKIK